MTHVTCRLTAKNRDQLRNPTLGNRVWATFTFSYFTMTVCCVEGTAELPRQLVRDSERQEEEDTSLADPHGPCTRRQTTVRLRLITLSLSLVHRVDSCVSKYDNWQYTRGTQRITRRLREAVRQDSIYE